MDIRLITLIACKSKFIDPSYGSIKNIANELEEYHMPMAAPLSLFMVRYHKMSVSNFIHMDSCLTHHVSISRFYFICWFLSLNPLFAS